MTAGLRALRDGLHRLSVTATSPDRSVRLTITGTGGPRIEFGPRGVSAHTEASLAAQVRAAAKAAAKGVHRAALALIGTERHDGAAPPAVPEARASSPRGAVTVVWRGDDDIDVSVAAGVLRRLADAQLAVELAAAIGAARNAYAAHVLELARKGTSDADTR